MTLNDISKNIYVINLKEREDRLDHIKKELSKISCEHYKIFEGVDGSKIINNTRFKNGMYGLILTYIKIYDEWKKTNSENILIIEDDCVFLENFNSDLEVYLNNIPNNWEMMYFGGNHNYHMGNVTHKINDYCIKLNNTYTAHCVLLKDYVFEDLINNLKSFNIENDVMLAGLQKKYNAYSPIKTMTKQLNNYSNIENAVVNYDWLIK